VTLILLVAKAQQGLASSYMCELTCRPLSARSSCLLRSTDRCARLSFRARTSLFQHRAFAVVGPALWTDIPVIPPSLRSL